ncbi:MULTISPECIES: CoA transferase [unclassified Bradyrhizobium]
MYPTKDGYLFVQATTPAFWKGLCESLGFPQLAEDPRYNPLKKRTALKDEIKSLIGEALLQNTALEWERLMLGNVPSIAVRSIEDRHVRSSPSPGTGARRRARTPTSRQIPKHEQGDPDGSGR